jgi:hypothetical protein
VAGKRIAFPIKTKEQGQRTYQSGLKHRVLTAPATPNAGIGEQVEVELQLQYADRSFILLGQVMHTGDVATIVQLDTLPAELLEVLGQRAPAVARPDEIEQTDVSPDTTHSRPITPPAELEETLRSPPADPYGGRPAPAEPEPAELAPAPTPEPAPAPEPEPEPVAAPAAPAPAAPAPAAPPSRPRSQPMSPRPAAAAPTASPPPSRQAAAQTATPSGGMPAYQAPATPAAGGGARGIPLPGRAIQTVPGAPLMEGSLGERSMREIFMDLLRQGSTGLLVVDGFRERYWGYVINGKPVRYSREPASRSESIEYQISRQKLIDPTALERVRYVSTIMGYETDEGVVRMGMISAAKTRELVLETAQLITDRLLAVNYGSFWFYEIPEFAKLVDGDPVNVMAVLWERSRQRFADIEDKAVRELVDKLYKHHVIVTEEGRALAGQLSIGGQEARFLQRYLRGGWQVAELLGRLELPTKPLMALVMSLQDLGIITLAEREGPLFKTMRAERFLIDRMDYMDRDHFAFLEAHWSCLEYELLAACDNIALTLDEPIMEQLEIGDIQDMKAAIRDKLVEVRQTFSSTERRRAYRAEIIGEDKRMMAADLFLKQGEMELFKADSGKAKDIFSRVLELDPGGSGSTERVGRARKVLGDLERGILTKPMGSQFEMEKEIAEFSPEDLDD